MDGVILKQFRPGWSAQAYLRLGSIKHHVDNLGFPSTSAGGDLPQLIDGDKMIPNEEIEKYLANEYIDLDEKLSESEKSQSVGFESLVRNDLSLALEWSRWGVEDHYKYVTRKNLLQVIPFPLNYIWTWFERKRVLFRLTQHHRLNNEQKAKQVANQAYKALSAQLGGQKWFFGGVKGPNTIDCIVFGHLMDAIREPIGSILFQYYPNLVNFCERIQNELFINPPKRIVSLCSISPGGNIFSDVDGFNVVYNKTAQNIYHWDDDNNQETKENDREKARSDREREFNEGSRNAIMFAGTVVAGYLLATNTIGIQFSHEDDDEEEDGDYYYEEENE